MRISSFVCSAVVAVVLAGCGGMAAEVASEEVPQASLESTEQGARQDGYWCYARCSNGQLYAGPDVTQNCTDWGQTACRNRLSSLQNADWDPPCKFANCYLYGDGVCYLRPLARSGC